MATGLVTAGTPTKVTYSRAANTTALVTQDAYTVPPGKVAYVQLLLAECNSGITWSNINASKRMTSDGGGFGSVNFDDSFYGTPYSLTGPNTAIRIDDASFATNIQLRIDTGTRLVRMYEGEVLRISAQASNANASTLQVLFMVIEV